MSENFTETISDTAPIAPIAPILPEKNVSAPKKSVEVPPAVEIPAPKTPDNSGSIIPPPKTPPQLEEPSDLINFSINKEADPVNLPESTPFKVPDTVGSKHTAAFFEKHLRVNGTPQRAGGKMVSSNKHTKHTHNPFDMEVDQSSSRSIRRSQRNFKGSPALEYPEQNITEKEAEQFIEKKGKKSGAAKKAAKKQAAKARDERAKNKKTKDSNKGDSSQKGPDN